MIELLTILVFSVLQSIFGIGILFFGTPTLILAGFPLPEALSVLLPASMTVSALQLWKARLPSSDFITSFAIWCMIPLFLALLSVVYFGFVVEIKLVIGAILLLYFIARISERAEKFLINIFSAVPEGWLITIGLVHGLSSLGGGLLGIFVAQSFHEKTTIRTHIAFCYLAFTIVQLSVLATLMPEVMHWSQLFYAALGAAIFILFGNRLFQRAPSHNFERVFTVVIGMYAIFIIATSARII